MSKSCFPNRHMRPEEYALWNVSRSLSHESGLLYFDGPEIAALFEDTGKDRIYRAAKALTEKGWFKLLAPKRRNPTTGLWLPSQYNVLSSEEWAKEHPHECGVSIPQNANGSLSEPFLKTRTSIPQNAKYLDKEDSEEKRYDAARNAAVSALRLFHQDSDLFGEEAFNLLRWILYRAARAGKVPQNVKYYTVSKGRFLEQYGGSYSTLLAQAAGDRFDKFTRDFLAEKSPDLLAWLEDKETEMYETEIREAPDLSDPLDDVPF